jgi:polysaccharide deacetylase 2 family uncharacterized protein YibQ
MHKRGPISLYIIVFIFIAVLSVLFCRRGALDKKRPVKIAIVIDDWGYNLNNINLLDSIEIPLTLAILPNLSFSGEIASIEHQYVNRELILHMPMEPENDSLRLEKDTILASMDSAEISSLIEKALITVPFVKGISNHMGSKVTQNREVICAVMKELRLRGMFFLDAVAVSGTICEQAAKKYGIAFAKRDVFLDNTADKEYISTQFDLLVVSALEKGSAVGIGHDKSLTLETIKEKARQLEGSNIEFVLISELVRI